MLELLSIFKEFLFFAAYISPSGSFPEPLSFEDEKQAIAALLEGDEEARDKLIRHNLRLVAHIAKKYNGSGFDQDDLISIGTIGLIKAVSTFNSHKGANLATYAARCIQNEILMALRSIKRRKGDVSLTDAIGSDKEGNEITIGDVIGTPHDSVADQVELVLAAEYLYKYIDKCLSPREKLVIEMRYGLGGDKSIPQREVAQILEISRSYVSRIEKKALEKLRREFESSGG